MKNAILCHIGLKGSQRCALVLSLCNVCTKALNCVFISSQNAQKVENNSEQFFIKV